MSSLISKNTDDNCKVYHDCHYYLTRLTTLRFHIAIFENCKRRWGWFVGIFFPAGVIIQFIGSPHFLHRVMA